VDQLGYQMEPDIFGPGAKALQLLKLLVSNDAGWLALDLPVRFERRYEV
jgi:hypothetical protein